MNQADNLLLPLAISAFLMGLFIILSVTIGIDCNGNPDQSILTSIDMAFKGTCTY